MAKTLTERLTAAVALVSKLQALVNSEAILTNVEVGNIVVVKFGRKDKARELEGVVKGLREGENGVKYAAVFIASEDGFDDQTIKVRVADIIENKSAVTEADEGSDNGQDADPLNQD